MTKANMKAKIAAAKARFKGLRFVGLSADLWTSRAGLGFIGIEISFIFFDEETGKFIILTMCLACKYMPGTHDAKKLADMIRTILREFGLEDLDIIIYTSDSGGGIPAAAKVLAVRRRPCDMHTIDTAIGRAIGEKGKFTAKSRAHGAGALEIKGFFTRLKEQANVFTNATQRTEKLRAAAAALDAVKDLIFDALFCEGETREKSVQKKIQLPNATRMFGNQRLAEETFEQQPYLDHYFDEHDPTSANRLSVEDKNENKHIKCILKPARLTQEWVQGDKYVTSTGAFVVMETLKNLYKRTSFSIKKFPGDEKRTAVSFASMPPLAQSVVTNMASELEYYYGWDDLEGLVAAFSDPRAKKNPHFLPHSVRARNEFGRRLEFVLAQDLVDDPDENTVLGASSEASGPPSPAAPVLVEHANIFDFDDEPDAAAEPVPASSPLVGSKRRLEVAPKTRE